MPWVSKAKGQSEELAPQGQRGAAEDVGSASSAVLRGLLHREEQGGTGKGPSTHKTHPTSTPNFSI